MARERKSAKSMGFVLDPELYGALRRRAQIEDKSMSSIIRCALRRDLRERDRLYLSGCCKRVSGIERKNPHISL